LSGVLPFYNLGAFAMNTQERDQINQLLKPLVEFKLTAKDSEAEALIKEAVAHQPDAAYLLVQRVLLLDHALNNAKARIDDLQRQMQASQSNNASFLGNDPWAQPVSNPAPVPGVGNYQQAPRYAPQAPLAAAPAPQQQAGGLFGGSAGGGSSFLGNMATTAAGVVAGGFLFQGIEGLLGHHGGGGFGGGGFGQGGFGQQAGYGEEITENTVVNNYYGDAPSGGQLGNDSYAADDSFAGNDFQNTSSDDSFFGGGDSDDSDWI
jgi:hypothetical protein